MWTHLSHSWKGIREQEALDMINDEQILATNLLGLFVINESSLGFCLTFPYLEISDSPADYSNSEREEKKK